MYLFVSMDHSYALGCRGESPRGGLLSLLPSLLRELIRSLLNRNVLCFLHISSLAPTPPMIQSRARGEM